MTLLRTDDLHVRLGGRAVLKGLSFSVEEGEFVGLIGPNGAGKSTLLKTMLGLATPEHGAVDIAGRNAAVLTPREKAHHVAYLAQEREIAWDVSVEAVVSLGRAPRRSGFGGLSAWDVAKVDEAMRRMEVGRFRHRPATALSGGEKARVLIARALAQETPLLLADEPTTGLDPSHQIEAMRLFLQLAGEGRGVVASLHDLGLAARWCTRLILLDNGRIVADGPPREVLTRESLRRVYGVEAHFGEAAGGMLVAPLNVVADRTDACD